MKKIILTTAMLIGILLSGCTQIITAPIEIAGATAGAVIDVAGSTVHAIAGDDDDDKK
ncbi:MAG: hypothetical protein IE880_02265 [Epsilonproteobacteria bacterium]|nr:hypothetical protein [Campylobacterota bacterium]